MGETASGVVEIAVLAVVTALLFTVLWLLDATRANGIQHDQSRRDTAPHPDDPIQRHGSVLMPLMPSSDQDFDGGLGWWGHRVQRKLHH